jgi:predicted MPP superfamily phosphohydrolase
LIAGHTHGGQVELPWVGPPITVSRYRKGHIVEDGRHLFVTTGVGTSIAPIRFRVTPELVMLSLAH